MARRPITKAPMEPRGSIVDERVQLVLVATRSLFILQGGLWQPRPPIGDLELMSAIVWVKPMPGSTDQENEGIAALLRAKGATVRVLPRDTEDTDVPAAAGSPSPLSDASEVRPVVAELVSELPEELRAAVGEFVEDRLSEAGI